MDKRGMQEFEIIVVIVLSLLVLVLVSWALAEKFHIFDQGTKLSCEAGTGMKGQCFKEIQDKMICIKIGDCGESQPWCCYTG